MTERRHQALEPTRMRLSRLTAGLGEAGYSMATMAKKLNMSTSWISDVENNKIDVSAAHVAAWASITNVSVDWLFGKGRTIGGRARIRRAATDDLGLE